MLNRQYKSSFLISRYIILTQHFMDRESQLIRLCTAVLGNATPALPDIAASVLVNQDQYNVLMNTITNHHVAFVFCLSVKKHLKSLRNGLVKAQAMIGCFEMENIENQDEVIRIAKGTKFYQYLQSQPSKLHKHKDHEVSLFGSKVKGDSQGKRLKEKSAQCPIIWYQSIIFLNILAHFSRGNSTMHSHLRKEGTNPTGVKSLIAELFAKLFAIIYLQSNMSFSWTDSFIDTLKFMTNFNQGDEAKSKEWILLIICELIQYLQEEQQSSKVKKLLRFFGQQVNSLLIAYLSQSIASEEVFKERFNFLSNKFLPSISDYISLANDPRKGSFHKYSCNIEDFQCSKSSYKMDELMNFNFQFIKESQQLLLLVNDYQTWKIATPIMEVIDKITLLTFIEDHKDLHTEKYHDLLYNLSNFLNLFLIKWLKFEAGEKEIIKDDDYHLETIIINVLGQIVNNYLPFLFDNKVLLNLIIDDFCHQIISKVPIQLSLGQGSPISCTFYFLMDIVRYARRLYSQSSTVSKIRHMTEHFLDRCSQTEYNQDFLCHSEEVQSCGQFFLPIIQLLQKFYDCEQDKLSNRIFAYMIKQVRTQENIGFKSVINVLMIEMIRNVAVFQSQGISKQKKGELLLCLLEKLSKRKDIQYLMLLDAVSQIDEESYQLNENTSPVCLIITSTSDESLPSFMRKITSEITGFLLASDSLYLANYAIYLLTRLCKQLRVICMGKIDPSLINIHIPKIFQYMQPVFDFVKDINLSVLDESDSYQQRGKLFELICYVGIKQIEDVYKIYSLIRGNLCGGVGPNQLKYLIDVAGLLSTSDNDKIDEVVVELVLLDLKDFKDIFSNFTARTLENELYFNTYTNFLLKYMGKLIKCCKNDQDVLAIFPQIFEGKLDIFAELYDEINCSIIHELYLAYVQIYPIRGKLPILPCVIFSTGTSTLLIDCLFRNIERLKGLDEIKKLFSNTFLRNTLDFSQNIQESLKGEITQAQNLPQYMLMLAEYLDSEDIALFFNSQVIIESCLIRLFQHFKEENLNSATFDSFDFNDDEDLDTSYELANSVEEFCRAEKSNNRLKSLMSAFDIFVFLQKRDGGSFLQQCDFFELAKNVLEVCRA